MWKDVPVLFFPSKRGEKTWPTGLGGSSVSSPPPPPPPPHTHTHTPHPLPLLLPPEKMLNLCYTAKRLLRFFHHHSGAQKKEEGVGVDVSACLSSLFFLLLGKNNTGISFHIPQVGLRSLAGFWHTWEFHSKWRLRGCCPEPFNYLD